MTQKFLVLNKQWQAFAWVVRLGQNRVPHTWLLDAAPGGYDNHASDLHKHSGVVQMGVLHGLMSQQKITMLIIYRIVEVREHHTTRLTENGDYVAVWWTIYLRVLDASSRYASLDIQAT
jgi:hypothetical protein